jgi:hypothetical protein
MERSLKRRVHELEQNSQEVVPEDRPPADEIPYMENSIGYQSTFLSPK